MADYLVKMKETLLDHLMASSLEYLLVAELVMQMGHW